MHQRFHPRLISINQNKDRLSSFVIHSHYNYKEFVFKVAKVFIIRHEMTDNMTEISQFSPFWM